MGSNGDPAMLLMAILPMTFIVVILVTTGLDQRGYLGPSLRVVGIGIPLAVVTASLALGLAALDFARYGQSVAHDDGLGLYSMGVGLFYLTWAQLHLVARASWSALVGAVGTVVAIVGFIVLKTAAGGSMGQSDVIGTGFELGLIMLLVPALAPTLAPLLAKREMPLQRAVVLSAFGVVVVAMFTTIALVGAA